MQAAMRKEEAAEAAAKRKEEEAAAKKKEEEAAAKKKADAVRSGLYMKHVRQARSYRRAVHRSRARW